MVKTDEIHLLNGDKLQPILFFVIPTGTTFSQGTIIGEDDDDNKEDIISPVINLILNLI